MITPLDNRVLVRHPRTDEKTTGGIILPESVRKKTDMDELEMEIVKLGEAAFHGLVVKPVEGDTVMVARYAGSDRRETKDDYEYRIVRDEDITAIKRDIDIQKAVREFRKAESRKGNQA